MGRNLRMWKSSDGRDTVPLGSHAQPYVLGQRVFGAIDNVAGTVVSVDAATGTFSVHWTDENAVGDVVYPYDTIMVRRAWPWETC